MQKLFTRTLWLLLGGLPLLAQAQSKPDLVPIAPFAVPTSVVAVNAYQLSAVIKNQGANGAQFNCIGYYLSADAQWDATDAYLGASCQSLLMPGQSGTCALTATIPARAAAGSQYLLLVADPLNAEQESDETNNVVSFAVTVTANTGPLPDLTLGRPSLAFGAVPPGGTTGAFTFLNNQGQGATGAYELGFYLSADTIFSATNDVFLGLVTGGSLGGAPAGAGNSTGTVHSAPALTIPAGTVPGRYYLVLMADPRNLIAEANEANNSRALPLQVTGTLAAGTGAAPASPTPYPNPVHGGSPLHLGLAGRKAVACYDATGRLVRQQVMGGPGGPATFDTGGLPAGLYLLRLGEGPAATTHRVQIN